NLGPAHEVRQCIQLFACIGSTTPGVDSHHQLGLVKYRKICSFNYIVKLNEGHAEPDIRLVRTVKPHRFIVGHARNYAQVDTFYRPEEVCDESFKETEDVFLLYESHFAVYLGELRLAVRTQILVPEAFHDLEITVITGHHQKLLEGLWRLGQGIEFAGIHTAWHHKIAGAFRCGFNQYRRLDFQKMLSIQVLACFLCQPM